MAIENFFNHKCDIYHLKKRFNENLGYGLPSTPTFYYSDVPDEKEIDCHFGVKSGNLQAVQNLPQKNLEHRTKLTLKLGTDVRINDKIIDKTTGLEYTAEQPVQVQKHHLFVYVTRDYAQSIVE